MTKTDVITILNNYNLLSYYNILKIDATNMVFKICDKNGDYYILKEKNNIERIKVNVIIAKQLKVDGLPAAVPILTKNNKYFVKYKEKYYILRKYLIGEPLSEIEIDENDNIIKEFGVILAKLHKSLAKIPNNKKLDTMDLYKDLFDTALPIIKNSMKTDKSFNNVEKLLKSNLEEKVINLNSQFIHRDFHPANILFHNYKLSGIIDFDISIEGYRIFDLCYFLTEILYRKFDELKNGQRWFEYIMKTIRGYEEISTLYKEEKEALWYVMISSQLVFTKYFITHNREYSAHITLKVISWLYENKKKVEKIVIQETCKLTI